MSTLIGEESVHALQQDIEDDDTTALPSPSSVATPTTSNPLHDNNNVDTGDNYRLVEDELQSLKESESRYKQQFVEAQKREKVLIRRLAAKEQEMQEYVNQNAELKAAQAPTMAALRSVLLDPAVNILFQKLKSELQATKARLEDTQNELSAWKFTPDSNTGKRLMAKCRLLYQENEELGKMTSNGRLAKLEGDLALQKSFSEEVKKSQSELDDFLQELDEDVEGMQSTILFLQQELKAAKETITNLERENYLLKNGNGASSSNNGHDCEQENDAINRNLDRGDSYLNGSRTTGEIIVASPTTHTAEQRNRRHSNSRNGAGDNSSNESSEDEDEDDDDDDDDDGLSTSSDDDQEITTYSKVTSNSKNGDKIKNNLKRNVIEPTTISISGPKKRRRSSAALSIDLGVSDTTPELH